MREEKGRRVLGKKTERDEVGLEREGDKKKTTNETRKNSSFLFKLLT